MSQERLFTPSDIVSLVHGMVHILFGGVHLTVAGWSAGLGCGSSLQKRNKKEEGPAGASPVADLMPKSVPRKAKR